MHIIGISGKAGSGKDTTANILEKAFQDQGLTTTRISFANGIKDTCANLFGWDRARLDNDAYYKEGGLGGWVPKGMPGAIPISEDEMSRRRPVGVIFDGEIQAIVGTDTNDDKWVRLDIDPACVALRMTRRVVMQKVGTECFRQGLHRETWLIVTKLAIQNGKYDADIGFVTDCRFLNEVDFIQSQNGTMLKITRPLATTHTSAGGHVSELEWEQNPNWSAIVTNPGTMDGLTENLEGVIEGVVSKVRLGR